MSNWPILTGGLFASGASNAPSDASFVVARASEQLTSERVLTSSNGITITDSGSSLSIGLDLVAGTNVTLTEGTDGSITIALNAGAGGGGGGLGLFSTLPSERKQHYSDGESICHFQGAPTGSHAIYGNLFTEFAISNVFPVYLLVRNGAGQLLCALTSSLTGSREVGPGTAVVTSETVLTCSLKCSSSFGVAYLDRLRFDFGG